MITPVENFGTTGTVGVGNASADQAAFTSAAAAGGYISLTPGTTYYLTNKIATAANKSGFICPSGFATIVMKTGTGQFDLSSFDTSFLWSGRHVCFNSNGFDDIIYQGIKFQLEASASIRCAIAIALRGGQRNAVKCCDFTGFDLPFRGMLTIQSVREFEVSNCSWYDCTSSKAGLSNGTSSVNPQTTGIEIDNDSVSGSYQTYSSWGRIVNCTFRNFELSGGAASGGQQSDAINIQNQGKDTTGKIIISNINAEKVGELLDIFGSDVSANNIRGNDIFLTPIKIIHGASRIKVTGVQVHRTGFAGVSVGNSGNVSWNTSNIEVTDCLITDIGYHRSAYTTYTYCPGVHFDGGNSPMTKEQNAYVSGYFAGYNNGTTPTMTCVVQQTSSGAATTAINNVFEGDGDTYADGGSVYFSKKVNSTGGDVIIRRRKKSCVRAFLSSGGMGLSANAAIPFNAASMDTNVEFNTSSGAFTAKCHMALRVRATYRNGGVPTGDVTNISILKNGLQQATAQWTGAGDANCPVVEDIVIVQPGDVITVTQSYLDNPGGTFPAQNLTTGSDLTYLIIQEL